MLAHVLKRVAAGALAARKNMPLFYLGGYSTTSKSILSEKKKQAYQVQDTTKKSVPAPAVIQAVDSYQMKAFESLLSELGRDLHQYLMFKVGSSKVDLSPILVRTQLKMQNQLKKITVLQLLNYAQVVKNICLSRLESLDDIVAVYKILEQYISGNPNNKTLVNDFCKGLWGKDKSVVLQIRALALLEYMSPDHRSNYLKNLPPLLKYFKTGELSILMFQKYYLGYKYSYELLDQIFSNNNFIDMEEINTSYLKMLFMEKIKGEFIPNEDNVFGKILSSVADRPNILSQIAFDKIVKIMQAQGAYVQSENARLNLEQSLNAFINIAKNQNYSQNSINLHQLVGLYLGFQQTNATGEGLLSQITFTSKTSGFELQKNDLQLYKTLLLNVLKNSENKLKYQRYDNLNKEYTINTIMFLSEFLPKYIPLWPEVILEVNHVGLELFAEKHKNQKLLSQFQTVFEKIAKREKLGVSNNIAFTLKILHFVKTYSSLKCFTLQNQVLEKLLKEAMALGDKQRLANNQLELIDLTLGLLGERCRSQELKPLLSKFNVNYIERRMALELSQPFESYLKTLDHEIIWLALLSAKCKSQGCQVDESIVEVFINEKLMFMLNSLSYEQVYQILVYVTELSRLKVEVYERLLENLSTFIIYIHDQSAKNCPFYLNPKYQHFYIPICRLIINHKEIFMKIHDRETLKVAQIMLVKNIEQFSNLDILNFLEVLGDAAFLNVSFKFYLKDVEFKRSELDLFQSSTVLKKFEYYNNSLLKHFEGRSSETDIKNKLKLGRISYRQIQQCFSTMEVYKTIIMDSDISIGFDLPEPNTKIADYKYMYVCQEIYKKIQKTNNFSFHSQNQLQNYQFKEVNLDREKDYMSREMLVVSGSENDFRIEDRPLPKYLKMEVWKSFAFFDNNLAINPKDLFLNDKKLTDQILSKIAKGVFGKYEKVKEVLREFSCNEDLLATLEKSNIQFEQHGAAFQFRKQDGEEVGLTLLCTTNSNYKILYICAYLMAKHGSKVIVLRQNQDVERVLGFIVSNLPREEGVVSEVSEEEEESEDAEE